MRRMLGTTKKIVAKDSKQFGLEIAKYIDSKEKKRGEKDKKAKEKKKDGGLLSMFSKDKPPAKTKEQDDPNGPAFWPLIRQVKVRCKAHALSTGAILVSTRKLL